MSPKRLTRGESRQHTRQRILHAARDLFSRQGYRGTSLEGIAETAGFSKGAVYSNWPSKEALFLELLDQPATPDDSQADIDLTPTRWALATLEFFLEVIDTDDIRSKLAQRYETARREIAGQLSDGKQDPTWGTWEELSTVVMALGSGLIIQNAIDPEATNDTLLPRVIEQLTTSPDRT